MDHTIHLTGYDLDNHARWIDTLNELNKLESASIEKRTYAFTERGLCTMMERFINTFG